VKMLVNADDDNKRQALWFSDSRSRCNHSCRLWLHPLISNAENWNGAYGIPNFSTV
jgi:hypothetical protein